MGKFDGLDAIAHRGKAHGIDRPMVCPQLTVPVTMVTLSLMTTVLSKRLSPAPYALY